MTCFSLYNNDPPCETCENAQKDFDCCPCDKPENCQTCDKPLMAENRNAWYWWNDLSKRDRPHGMNAMCYLPRLTVLQIADRYGLSDQDVEKILIIDDIIVTARRKQEQRELERKKKVKPRR